MRAGQARPEWCLDDCGSLNGTYVNRQRIDSQRLADGDELQIGKYKLTFRVTWSATSELQRLKRGARARSS